MRKKSFRIFTFVILLNLIFSGFSFVGANTLINQNSHSTCFGTTTNSSTYSIQAKNALSSESVNLNTTNATSQNVVDTGNIGSSTDGLDYLDIVADACSLYDVNSKKFLYGKNQEKQMYPASTTKTMTAILVLENCKDLSAQVTVSYYAVHSVPYTYSIANLYAGETFTVKDLLYTMMIASANDSAYALAQYVANGGNNYPTDSSISSKNAFNESIQKFADMMNEKAKEIGCKNTNFVNPNGISNSNHYTTANDLALIGDYAYQNSTIRTIASTMECSLPNTDKYSDQQRTFKSTNHLIDSKHKGYYEYANGLKTGYTDAAMSCIIASAKKGDRDLIAVVLHYDTSIVSSSREEDCKKLFEYGFNNYKNTNLIDTNSIAKNVTILNGTKETRNLNLYASENLNCLVKTNVALDVTPEITLTKVLAPIAKGEVVGTVEYKIDGVSYKTNLIAEHNVDAKNYSPVLWICLIIALILFFWIRIKLSKGGNRRNKNRGGRTHHSKHAKYHKNTKNRFYQNKYLDY